jgi:hypothetical protein
LNLPSVLEDERIFALVSWQQSDWMGHYNEFSKATHKTILLGSDSHLPNHAHLVMQGADVREDSGVRESDAETCHAKGRLW